ncbi:PAS domain S-box protein [uncultured Abyssibacter sp.]|uniref:sensor histidine kinase n=1 Tax=uncultured Abyssibacter sp. TaxID=2320202 RepID=UPI0032B1366F
MDSQSPPRELLQAVLDVSQDLNGVALPDGTVVYVSPAMTTIIGWEPADAIGGSVFRFIVQEDHAAVQSALMTVAAGTPIQFRCRVRDKRDQARLVEVRARPLELDGRVHVVFSGRDATDTDHAERARAESEVRFRRLMDAAPDPMVVVQDGRVVFANTTAGQMFGAPNRDQLLGRTLAELVHPDDLDDTLGRMLRIAGGETLEPQIRRTLRADGSVLWVESRGTAVSFKGRSAVLCILREVVDRAEGSQPFEQAVSQLRAANAELTQFADTLTRDLHEPLRSIGGYLQLLRRRHANELGDESLDYIDTAVTGVRRIESLIADLKEFSRIHTHGRPLRPVSLETVVIAAQRRMSDQIEASGLRCRHDVLPLVIGDESQLVKAFCHLFSNAIKYSQPDESPSVTVTAERADNEWRIGVTDNGIGIDQHHQDRVFEVFRRLQPHGQAEGTGIGLATVKRIIERHHGKIWVNSAPGQGTSFRFTLAAVPD